MMSIRVAEAMAPFVLDGPINRHAFETYVARVLVPELRRRDLMIMDNMSSHKGPGVRELTEAAGASVRYLPPCSPDFDPIENAFAKPKALDVDSIRTKGLHDSPNSRYARPKAGCGAPLFSGRNA